MQHLAEFLGALFSIAGALVLARKSSWSRFGWLGYLGGNVAWLIYAVNTGNTWLTVQTVAFTATTALGIWRWIINPAPEELELQRLHAEVRRLRREAGLNQGDADRYRWLRARMVGVNEPDGPVLIAKGAQLDLLVDEARNMHRRPGLLAAIAGGRRA